MPRSIASWRRCWRVLRRDGVGQDEAQANGAGPQPRRRATLRREFPDLVTLEPAEDDDEVFGEVWPLIVEWRDLKAVHPDARRSLSWLLTRNGSWRWN